MVVKHRLMLNNGLNRRLKHNEMQSKTLYMAIQKNMGIKTDYIKFMFICAEDVITKNISIIIVMVAEALRFVTNGKMIFKNFTIGLCLMVIGII